MSDEQQPQSDTNSISTPVEDSVPIQPEPAIEPTIQAEQSQQITPQPEPISIIPPVQPVQPSPKSFLAKALEKIQFRKRAKLDKIMKFAQDKKSITNDQVEKILHVSDATATRYLSELVKQNRLKRTGLAQNPRYEPSGGSNGGN